MLTSLLHMARCLIVATFGSIEFPTIFAGIGVHMADTYHLFGTTYRSYEVIGFQPFP